jgi:hypothetical protein
VRAGQREGSGSPFPTSRSSGRGERFVRVAAIAASVSAPYVIDHRLWRFVLHLERRDQGVLSGDRHTSPVAGEIDSNREFEGHIRIFLSASRLSDYGPLAFARFPARKTSGLLAALGEEITLVEDILQVQDGTISASRAQVTRVAPRPG